MCAYDTFLCTYYLRRPHGVNIDCRTVGLCRYILSRNWLRGMGGDIPSSHENAASDVTTNVFVKGWGLGVQGGEWAGV